MFIRIKNGLRKFITTLIIPQQSIQSYFTKQLFLSLRKSVIILENNYGR